MANIMLQYGGTTYRTLGYTGRVTNPSLILSGGGQTLYTPLFAVASGAEGRDGNYYYKCCPLAVKSGGTTYRAAYQRRYADSFSRTISTTITHSGKTGTSTTTQPKTVEKSGTESFKSGYITGGETVTKTVTVEYGVTFTGTPSVSVGGANCRLSSAGTSSCEIIVAYTFYNSSSVPQYMTGSTDWSVSVAGNVSTTITTYPDETKSATASGDFSYGHTYGSAPSLSADNGVSVSNNSGNASFHASKTLTGTVSFNSSKTLSQAFTVSFSGAA